MKSLLDKRTRTALLSYSLILPAFLVVFALAAYGCFWLVRMSLVEMAFGAPWDRATWVGLDNYRWLLLSEHSTFWESVRITALYMVGTLLPELVLGMTLALLLNQKILGRSLYTAILLIPLVVMPAMVGMVWRLYFSYDGLVNFFVESLFGTKLNWYGPQLALPAVIIVDIWEWTPFFVLILLAGLQALPQEPFEAARVDGASAWQVFRYVTLPMLSPVILTAAILRLMDILRIFDVIYAMFGGGPGRATTTLPLYIYRLTMVARNVGRGSAVSVMLILIILGLTLVLVRFLESVKFER